MNRAYKVIWSSVKNCYVVTSELAKNKGKSGRSVLCTLLAAAGIMGVTAFSDGMLNTTYAASKGITMGDGAVASEQFSIALGDRSYVGVYSGSTLLEGIAVGFDARVEDEAYRGIAIGSRADVKTKYGIAMGYEAKTENDYALAMGYRAKATDIFGTAVGYKAESTGYSSISVGAMAKSVGENSIATGTKAESAGENSVAIGATTQSAGEASIAAGVFAKSAGKKSVAVGASAYADQENALAVGYMTHAKGLNSVAVGSRAKAFMDRNIAIGYNSQAVGNTDIAIGDEAYATGGQSIAIGDGSRATFNHATSGYRNGSVVLGYNATSNALASIVIGDNSHISGNSDKEPHISQHGIAIGYNTNIINTQSSVALGESITINNSIDGVTAVGSDINVGKNAKLSTALGNWSGIADNAEESLAAGYNAQAKSDRTVTLGSWSTANEAYGIALGYYAHANTRAGVAIGASSEANTEFGKVGYDILLDGASTLTTPVWRSTLGAVSIGDIDNNLTRQITNVAAGMQDTDAVNVAQLKQVREFLKNNVPQVPQYEAGEGITITPNGDNKFIISSNIKASGDLDFKGDVGDTAKPQDKVDAVGQPTGDKEMTIVGGITDENSLTENNIGVVAKDDKLVVKLGKNLKNLDSIQVNNEIKVGDKVNIGGDNITVGDVKITDEKITTGKVEISKNGINAGDEKITNVADGEVSADSKEAVNGSQLYAVDQKVDNISQSVDNLNGRVNRLDSRINKVGAGAAALAALHPLDFDPDEKLTFSAGMGNYRGENAAALGMFYRPDEKTMFSLGGTVGNGENMVNVGVSFALDRTSNVNNSKVAMAKDIVALRTQVAQLTALVNHMALAKGMESEIHKIFPDVPENHWAYEYVDGLAAQGVIEGYPDGSFGGNRLMTRYEFAAMLYRAMEKGAQLDGRIIKEFETELGRVRVDRISGEDNDEDKVERVRVNVGEDKDDYGSKIILADE